MSIYELDTLVSQLATERIVVSTTTTIEVQTLQENGEWLVSDNVTKYGNLTIDQVRDVAADEFDWNFEMPNREAKHG
jgi:hypothetical protein